MLPLGIEGKNMLIFYFSKVDLFKNVFRQYVLFCFRILRILTA